jgi:hypothetical protein
VPAALLLDEVIAMPAKPSLDALSHFQPKESLVLFASKRLKSHRKEG